MLLLRFIRDSLWDRSGLIVTRTRTVPSLWTLVLFTHLWMIKYILLYTYSDMPSSSNPPTTTPSIFSTSCPSSSHLSTSNYWPWSRTCSDWHPQHRTHSHSHLFKIEALICTCCWLACMIILVKGRAIAVIGVIVVELIASWVIVYNLILIDISMSVRMCLCVGSIIFRKVLW